MSTEERKILSISFAMASQAIIDFGSDEPARALWLYGFARALAIKSMQTIAECPEALRAAKEQFPQDSMLQKMKSSHIII
jgi:hypothetical protein